MSYENYNKLYAPPCPFTKSGRPIYKDASFERELKAWMDDNIKKGSAFITANRGYKPALITLDILRGDNNNIVVEDQQSDVVLNKARRVLREIIATQANIKPDWGYSTQNAAEAGKATLLEKYLKWWWHQGSNRTQFNDAMQFAACSTGYIYLFPYKDFITGEIQLRTRALDFQDVMPIGIPSDMDLQHANAVIIKIEMPLSEAHEMFYNDVDRIVPDRSMPSWAANRIKQVKEAADTLVNLIRRRRTEGKAVMPFPTVDVFIAFVRDTSYNKSGKDVVYMEGNKSRVIPSYFGPDGKRAQIKTGRFESREVGRNQETGQPIVEQVPIMRTIEIDDCRYFPNHRQIIYISGSIIADQSFTQWTSGLLPVFDFRYDRKAREYLGLSAIYDALSLGRAKNRLLRAVTDMIIAKMYAPVGIDKSIDRNKLKNFNPRAAIQYVIRYSISNIKNAIVQLIDPKYYEVDPQALPLIEKYEQEMDYISGSTDFKAIAQARQLPAADTLESLLKAQGSLATEQSQGMEEPIQRFGTCFMGMVLQFITTPKLLRIVGHDGVSAELFDWDPMSIVPQHQPGDIRPRSIRAKEFLKQLSFFATPNSLHEMSSMTQRLTLLQLQVKGVPIPSKKLYTSFYPDANDYDQMEKDYYAELKKKAEYAAEIAIAAQMISLKTEGRINTDTLINSLDPTRQAGRPSLNETPPKQGIKEAPGGEPRVTNETTSTS